MTRREIPPDLEAALAAEPDAEALRAVWRGLPTALDAETPAHATARDAAWARLAAKLHDPTRAPSPDDDTPVLPLRPTATAAPGPVTVPVSLPVPARSAARRLAWAALFTAAVLGGGATWRIVPTTMRAPVGGPPMSAELADGTQLVLSPGSAVRLSRALGAPAWLRPATRTITLEGEAFFSVSRDGRRFIVQTSDAAVEVLGTRFDVRSPVGGLGTRVAVEEGRVAVTPRVPRSRAVLGAGDVAVVQQGEAVRSHPVMADRLGAWRSGGLAAIDEPLGVVLAEVARRAGIEITLDETAGAVGPVSVYYPDAPEPATVVADLATAHGLAFTRTNRGFAVTGGAAPR